MVEWVSGLRTLYYGRDPRAAQKQAGFGYVIKSMKASRTARGWFMLAYIN